MDTQDREDLNDFVWRADRIRELRIFRGGEAATFEISGSLGGPIVASATGPEEEMVEALVSRLRPLLLQKERTSLRHVLDLCRQYLNDADLRRRLEEIRAAWKRAQKQGPIKLVINDEQWRPEVIAVTIINAYYAHDDSEKRRRLQELGAIETMITRTVFLAYMTEAANAALAVAWVVRTGLREGRFR